jgi:hypothetical protein
LTLNKILNNFIKCIHNTIFNNKITILCYRSI